jgi:NDP-sugar pyrophosphorylase family protein
LVKQALRQKRHNASWLVGTQVEASVIGRDCHIGVGACVSGSYLLDGARVGPGAQVSGSLLCAGAAVGAHAVLHPGCILSFKARPASNSAACRAGMHVPLLTSKGQTLDRVVLAK